MPRLYLIAFATAACLASPILMASAPADGGGELRIITPQDPPTPLTGTLTEQLAAVTPTQPRGRIWALASAIGGQVTMVASRESVGSNLDPYLRRTIEQVDRNLDSIVLRGMDRVIARRDPQSERLFMRLNPALVSDVPPPEREKVAFQRLIAELEPLPQRQSWDRIVVVTPHYRAFEQSGLASRLSGVGVYFQELPGANELTDGGRHEVVEPDGTPGKQRRNRFVALYYYAMISVLDAKTLQVLSQEPWLFDQKIHDSKSDSLSMARSIPVGLLAERLSAFTEQASDRALGRTLNLIIDVRDLKVIQPGAQTPAAPTPAPSTPPPAATTPR